MVSFVHAMVIENWFQKILVLLQTNNKFCHGVSCREHLKSFIVSICDNWNGEMYPSQNAE